MTSRASLYFKLVIFVLLILGAAIWIVFQWQECRELGFSIFYCVQHVG